MLFPLMHQLTGIDVSPMTVKPIKLCLSIKEENKRLRNRDETSFCTSTSSPTCRSLSDAKHIQAETDPKGWGIRQTFLRHEYNSETERSVGKALSPRIPGVGSFINFRAEDDEKTLAQFQSLANKD